MKNISFGIDIGGINSAIGLVDNEGQIYSERIVPTKDFPFFDQYASYIETLAQVMSEMLEALDFEYELQGIGIGAPNASFNRGTIEMPANLWKYREAGSGDENLRIFNVVNDLKSYFPQCEHVYITNDANAATVGEMLFGAGRSLRDFIMVTLGTGLGSGFIVRGDLVYGKDGFAGELGHINVDYGGRECGCGMHGCLETYVSAKGICRTALEVMAQMREPSVLRDIPFSKLESLDISKAALNGDKVALETFRRTGEYLGRALGNMIPIFSPEAIVLFGGLAKAGDLILEPTKKYMDENTMPNFRAQTKLLMSEFKGGNIAIAGAAALVWQNMK